MTYDPNTLLLTNISGPICKCGGDQTRTYTYDAYERLTAVSDDGINGTPKHTFTYAYGRDAGGNAYPGPTSIVENVDMNGTTRTTSMTYYPIGDPRQDLPQTTTLPSVDAPGNTMTVNDAYSAAGLLTQRTTTGFVNGSPTAYTSKWSYDARGRMLTATGPRTDVQQTTTFGYFSDTDGDGQRAGQLSTVTDALNHVTRYGAAAGFTSYTPFGDPQSVTDPNGVTTAYGYDTRGRLVSTTVEPGSEGEAPLVTRQTYDSAGRVATVTKPLGNVVFYDHDTSNRLVHVKRADAQLNRHERLAFAYDAFDEPTSFSAWACAVPSTGCSWNGVWSAGFTYSPQSSDMTQITNADGTYRQFAYTAQGGVAAINDENHTSGSDYTYTYDLAGRKLSESQVLASAPGGSVTTRFLYDLHDNVVGVTDQNGNTTTYHYDDFDRLTRRTSPVSGVTTYSYDPASNVIATTNANGTTATYSYDALDRVVSENDVKGAASAAEAWSYDDPTTGHYGIGRLSTVTDPSGSAGYTYDRLGSLQVVNKNVAGNLFTYGYFYDNNENLIEITYPDNTILSYTYDFADRPYSAQQTQPTSALGFARRAQSIAQLRARGLAAPNHAARPEAVSRPGLLRPLQPIVRRVPVAPQPITRPGQRPIIQTPATATRHTASAGARPDSTIVTSATYMPFGPVASIAFGNGTTQTLSYDQRYRPIENKLVKNGTTVDDHVYAEDAVGNITAINDALNAGYNRAFGYDDLNRLTTANSGANLWGTATGNGHTYDAMGNVTRIQLGSATTVLSYQAGGAGSSGLPLIASFTTNGSSVGVAYDAAGSTVSAGSTTFTYGARELLASPGSVVQSYMYDASRQRVQTQLPDGTQRVSLFDSSNHLLAESALSATPSAVAYDYVWFGDRPVAQLDATSTHWTYADHLGTPLIQTDVNAATTWQTEYAPFGQVWSLRAGDVHQPIRLPGQTAEQFDVGANGLTSFSYNNARWYAPSVGRYTQVDPVTSRAAVDPFSYASDNPVVNDDPSGLGGPYHPPDGVRYHCSAADSCSTLRAKMWIFERMISSHTGWDKTVPSPGGGSRHAGEIADLWRGYGRCIAIYYSKCQNNPPYPIRAGSACPSQSSPPALAAGSSSMQGAADGAAAAGAAVAAYWIISEGSRVVFPPRNLVPVP